MNHQPFESIESAYEFVALLLDAVEDSMKTINEQISQTTSTNARQLDALRLVDYKLKALGQHLVASRRLLNDLRTLRRVLLGE